MNDTSKPTPGPWHVVCTPGHNGIGEVRVYSSDMGLPIATVNSNWPGRTVDAAFIAEAGTVYHETNLTPRQLLEQRDELLNAVEGFIKSFHHSVITDDLEQFPAMAAGIAAMNKARGIPKGCTRTFICEHPNWPNGIWEIDPVSALAQDNTGWAAVPVVPTLHQLGSGYAMAGVPAQQVYSAMLNASPVLLETKGKTK